MAICLALLTAPYLLNIFSISVTPRKESKSTAVGPKQKLS